MGQSLSWVEKCDTRVICWGCDMCVTKSVTWSKMCDKTEGHERHQQGRQGRYKLHNGHVTCTQKHLHVVVVCMLGGNREKAQVHSCL
jgi:hypothetical protein